jgi:transcriptional regulator with XRE-family HTH domain
MHVSDKPRLNIRAIRESRGYTQEYMAEMLNICQSTYANLESGKTTLSINRLLGIAEILDTDFAELIDHKKPPGTMDFRKNQQSIPLQPNLYQETKGVYEQLIHELRNEIDFLRSLIRTS